MLQTIGKTLGSALAALCLVATLAVADEMTCTASDGKGNCTTAVGADGKPVVVVGEGLKVGEKMDCVDRGTRWRRTVASGVTEAAKTGGEAWRLVVSACVPRRRSS